MGWAVAVAESEIGKTLEDSTEPTELADLNRRLRRMYVVLVALVLVVLFGGVAVAATTWARTRTPSQTSPEVGFARDMYTHHGQAVTMALLLRNTAAEPLNTLTVDIVTSQAEQQGMMLAWLSRHDLLAADDSWQPMAWMEGTSGMAEMAAHGRVSVTPGVTASAELPPASVSPTASASVSPSATASVSPTASASVSPASSPSASASPSVSAAAEGSVLGWGVMPGMATDAELTQLVQLRGEAREVMFLQLMMRHHRAGLDMAQTYLDLGTDPELRELAQGIVTSQGREITIITDLLTERGATAAQ